MRIFQLDSTYPVLYFSHVVPQGGRKRRISIEGTAGITGYYRQALLKSSEYIGMSADFCRKTEAYRCPSNRLGKPLSLK